MSKTREEILNLLTMPISVSNLKKKFPKMKSFGTLAYHLNKLEQEGLIKKMRIEKERGNPTMYFLSKINPNSIPKTLKEIEERNDNYLLIQKKKILKLLEKKPLKEKELIEELKQNQTAYNSIIELDVLLMLPILEEMGVIEQKIFITQKGRELLKENDRLVR